MLTDTITRNLQEVVIAWPAAITDQAIRALALAVFVQAVRDASTTSKNGRAVRDSARAWLLEEGASWARLLGKRIDQAAIEAWIDNDCPPGDRRKRNPKEGEKL